MAAVPPWLGFCCGSLSCSGVTTLTVVTNVMSHVLHDGTLTNEKLQDTKRRSADRSNPGQHLAQPFLESRLCEDKLLTPIDAHSISCTLQDEFDEVGEHSGFIAVALLVIITAGCEHV